MTRRRSMLREIAGGAALAATLALFFAGLLAWAGIMAGWLGPVYPR